MIRGMRSVDLRPGKDRDEGDGDNEGEFDAEGHQEGCDDASAEDGHPELRGSDAVFVSSPGVSHLWI